MVEAFRKKLEFERSSSQVHGISFMRGVKGINHSQFVDDTLFLGGASIIITKRFKAISDSFLNTSRIKFNNGKS
jgi:hypothetical protein